MTETSETEAQTRTRSALGGFERDAKTFEGHLNRITASAQAFVTRCAKFAISDPDHPRLAETAELLAEAKRILGKDQGSAGAGSWSGDGEPREETGELVQWHALAERVRQLEAEVFGDAAASPVEQAEALAPIVNGADPLANLAPDQSARVQAAIDAAAQKRAAELAAEAAASIPVSTEPIMPNPFTIAPVTATSPNGPAVLINPFAGLTP